jgi:hypothetical protein
LGSREWMGWIEGYALWSLTSLEAGYSGECGEFVARVGG